MEVVVCSFTSNQDRLAVDAIYYFGLTLSCTQRTFDMQNRPGLRLVFLWEWHAATRYHDITSIKGVLLNDT